MEINEFMKMPRHVSAFVTQMFGVNILTASYILSSRFITHLKVKASALICQTVLAASAFYSVACYAPLQLSFHSHIL